MSNKDVYLYLSYINRTEYLIHTCIMFKLLEIMGLEGYQILLGIS